MGPSNGFRECILEGLANRPIKDNLSYVSIVGDKEEGGFLSPAEGERNLREIIDKYSSKVLLKLFSNK